MAIRNRSVEAGTDGVYLQCSYPEQMGLPRPLVTRLAGAAEPDPLDAIEEAIVSANGELSAEALWPILSRLDRIWILGDKQGAPVGTGKVFDCFTSLPLADRLRMQHDVKGTLHFVKASAFFRHAAAKGLQVGINRGLAQSWMGVLPAIS
jgi:hypothetical protein